MSNIKTQSHVSPLEQRAYQQRLDQLGLKVKSDGTIDESSAAKLKHGELKGLDALKAVIGEDGVLSADAAAKLEKQLSLMDKAVGKKSPSVSQQETAAAQSLSLSMDGLASALFIQADQLSRGVKLDEAAFEKLGRDIANLEGVWSKIVRPDSSLVGIDPEALRTFVASFEQLTQASAAFGVELSKQREALLSTEATTKEVQKLLKGLSTTIHQLDLIRDASLLVFRASAKNAQPNDIGALTEQLAAKLSPHQAKLKENAEANAKRVSELLDNLKKLADSPTIDVLAKTVFKQFNSGDQNTISHGTARALLVLAFEIPDTFAKPNGPQQLWITPHGLRAGGADGYGNLRELDPTELASAGIAWSTVEKAVQSLLENVSSHPERLKPEIVKIGSDDRLYTSGRFETVDMKAAKQAWKDALGPTKDNQARADALQKIIDESVALMNAGELRDFFLHAMKEAAKIKLPYDSDHQKELGRSLIGVFEALASHLDRHPYKKVDLSGADRAAKDFVNHINKDIYDSETYSRWLSLNHPESKGSGY